jgi:tRNA threonylcarbamoyladenosine biosynthesis protein TsaE
LGAGKTHFVQGLAAAMGIGHPVTSPTYTLVQEYSGTPSLIHIDLYRIHDEGDAAMLGLDDILSGDGIKAVEWAERAPAALPSSTIHITFRHGASQNERTIEVKWPELGGCRT